MRRIGSRGQTVRSAGCQSRGRGPPSAGRAVPATGCRPRGPAEYHPLGAERRPRAAGVEAPAAYRRCSAQARILEDERTTHDRRKNATLADPPRLVEEQVPIDDHQVGQLANLYRAGGMVQVVHVRGAERESPDRLLEREPLLGQERLRGATRICGDPVDGDVDLLEGV